MLLSLQASAFFDEMVNRAMIFAFYKLFAIVCERGAFL